MELLHRETSMMEDCATSMAAQHGCTDDKAVIESFKEALIGRVGADRYRMWFSHGVSIALDETQPTATDATSDSSVADGNDHAGVSRVDAAHNGDAKQASIVLAVRGQFALDRLRQNFIREIRGAAMQACGGRMEVQLRLDEPHATQAELPLVSDNNSHNTGEDAGDDNVRAQTTASKENQSGATKHKTQRVKREHSRASAGKPTRRVKPLARLIAESTASGRKQESPSETESRSQQPELPNLSKLSALSSKETRASSNATSSAKSEAVADKGEPESRFAMTAANFVAGTSNQLAFTAMSMVCQDPKTASPIFFCGPTGTGKTHMMAAIADQLRRRHRMRRVMHLSAEQFTNDFISSVGNSGITAFRRRYREVDALLIDDVQFLGAKKATLREMLYTVETLASAGRPLIFSGLHSPTEIPGLSRELAGRMASGLVCPIQPLDLSTRRVIFGRWLEERCPLEVPAVMTDQVNSMLAGDGRVISGVVNMVNTLQRMYGRMPSMDELRQFGGDLLRVAAPVATLNVIETAVCEA
ncbi:MAG: DnaA ATPase domain-containing protein, partial [Rubripirellula sp.]